MRHFIAAPILLSLLGACSGETDVTSSETPLKSTEDGDPVYPDNPETPNGTNVCKTITVSGHVYYNDLRTNGRFGLRYMPPFGIGGSLPIGRQNPWSSDPGALNKNYLGLLDATVSLYEIDKSGPFEGCRNTDFIGQTTINSAGYWSWTGQVCDSCRDDFEGAEDNGISIAAKVALRNCSRPNERCFGVREPTGVPSDSAPHFDDPWSGPTYERWLRGAHVSTPIVIHATTTVDIGKDYFQDDPTPGPGDISDLDAQAASVFASAVDVTRKLHVEDTVDFGPEEVSFYFPDVWGWSHSHQDESDKVCIMAPGRTKESTTPTDVPTEWYEGSSAAHEYGHLVHYWQWDGNGKWVSYAFDVNGDGDISDEEAEQSSETPEHTIAALKEGWAELVEHWTFEGTDSPSRCSAVENDGAMQCHGPVSCRINRQFTADVKHALCDLVDDAGNLEASDKHSFSMHTMTSVLREVWNNHPIDAADVAGATRTNETSAPFGICDIARRLVNRGSASTTAMTATLAQSLLECNL